MDECRMFAPHLCRGGVCINAAPGFSCYCPTGYYYEREHLQCVGGCPHSIPNPNPNPNPHPVLIPVLTPVPPQSQPTPPNPAPADNDECRDEADLEPCVGGRCVNTVGSYYCVCSPPLVLDGAQRRCVPNDTRKEAVGLCWQEVGPDLVCGRPRLDRALPYSECCCLYGAAWGMDCALCPARDSASHRIPCSHIPHSPYPIAPYAIPCSPTSHTPYPYSHNRVSHQPPIKLCPPSILRCRQGALLPPTPYFPPHPIPPLVSSHTPTF
uniref:TB domain-containing protein n=1 Tax=Coturnix japonica TaxID=93934 RepID=A0A8C2SMH2_COTJA